MPRINLLPWRQQQRKERKAKFFVALGGAAIAAAAVAGTGYLTFERMISRQEARNNVLRKEIVELDKQIEKINTLEREKARFIARMEIIERLQRSRPEIVHLFDELAKTVPDGAYLTAVTQNDKRLKIEGVAQSSTRVSTFMRRIDESAWLKNPELEVIENKDKGPLGASFVLFAEQISLVKPDGEADAATSGNKADKSKDKKAQNRRTAQKGGDK
jgi:type IV pilus assembly protein PilN